MINMIVVKLTAFFDLVSLTQGALACLPVAYRTSEKNGKNFFQLKDEETGLNPLQLVAQ